MIKLTTLSPRGEWRSFSLECTDLEVVYQSLLAIVHRGDTLVNATWLDAQGCLPLPLRVLERPPFCNPVTSLRQQWESLLGPPLNPTLLRAELKQQLFALRQHRLGCLRRSLSLTQDWIERAHQQVPVSPQQAHLLDHYERLLAGYSVLLIRLETSDPLP